MKYFLLTLLAAFSSLAAQAVPLTFRVDMSQQTVSPAGVHVAGTFQNEAGFPADWNPATTALTDPDNDNIYELTVNVPAGVYFYKFINGNSWAGAELPPATCGVDDGGGNINRQVTLINTAYRMPAVPFGGCNPQVRFSVNMRGRTVSRSGVHVVGNFQSLAGYGANWDPTTVRLQDPDGDEIYEAQIALPAFGRFQYRFVNGNTLTAAEVVPAACGFDDGNGTLNRTIDATAPVTATPTVCFGTCTPCGSSPTNYSTHWWNDAVFYEIFVRSFYDSNGDGRGDFAGMTQKLDYLNDGNPATTTDLGVTALWLMPMMESPSYHGYDVTNYLATEPDYGTMAEFEAFLAAAHARGIKVIIDLVLNHTSSQHVWFQQSASSPNNPLRNWYIWSDTNPGFPGPWGQTVWHRRNNSYYYGIFYDGMPDLNWSNPGVQTAMWDITRFWLQRGVDGYRLDAIKYLDEDGRTLENTPETFRLLEQFNDTVKRTNPNALTVGEAWSDTRSVVPYVVNDRLDVCFEFDLSSALINSLNAGNPAALRQQLDLVERSYPKLQYATFLSNHDQNRVLGALNGDLARMKQAAALYLTMPGVPFLYYGEEVGMLGAGVDEDKRKPMQWTAGPNAGFSTATPWRAPNGNYAQFNVASMQADPASLLNHYKQLIRLRTAHEPLRKGYLVPATTSAGQLLSYGRVFGSEAVLMVSNFGSAAVANAELSLAISTLPAGRYQVTELYTGQAAGSVTLNGQGGFSNWTVSLPAIAANQTWMLRLVPQSLNTATANAQPSIELYPNPANDYLQIKLAQAAAGTAQVQVFDLQGRRLLTTEFSGRQHVLNTAAWAAGTYFVRVQTGAAVSTQRIVVTR